MAQKKEQNHHNPLAPASLLDLATANRHQTDHGTSRVIEGEDGQRYVQRKVNKAIYAKGLPKDVTEEEFLSFFGRAGVLKKDPDTGKEVYKLYRDEEGNVKGDALITYFRPESVAQAFALLHEAPIRPGFVVLIEEAKFKLDANATVKTSRRSRSKRKREQKTKAKENEAASDSDSDDFDDEHAPQPNADGLEPATAEADVAQKPTNGNKNGSTNKNAVAPVIVKRKKKKVYDQSAELSWEDKEQKHVILKKMFRPEQAISNIDFYDELRDAVMEEAKKLGHVESVKVFERNPEGVIAVKFATGSAAEKCVAQFNGRLFDGVHITCEYYDGFTDYTTREKEEEVAKRDESWASWLEKDD